MKKFTRFMRSARSLFPGTSLLFPATYRIKAYPTAGWVGDFYNPAIHLQNNAQELKLASEQGHRTLSSR